MRGAWGLCARRGCVDCGGSDGRGCAGARLRRRCEGASGFGTPVAVTAAILIGLGFSPLAASGLSLIANTAPVAYGALGTPIAGLANVTDCQPVADSPLNVAVASRVPPAVHRLPTWVPVLAADL